MAKSNTTKYLLIAGVLVAGYLLYKNMGTSVVNAITSAGNSARDYLATFVPNDTRYNSIVQSLTDSQAAALQQWNELDRPASGWTDPVLGPVLNTFKNNGGYFYVSPS